MINVEQFWKDYAAFENVFTFKLNFILNENFAFF